MVPVDSAAAPLSTAPHGVGVANFPESRRVRQSKAGEAVQLTRHYVGHAWPSSQLVAIVAIVLLPTLSTLAGLRLSNVAIAGQGQ